jgi:hypothetical protein
VSFAAITLCVASQRVFILASVHFVTIQPGNFWIHPRTNCSGSSCSLSNTNIVTVSIINLMSATATLLHMSFVGLHCLDFTTTEEGYDSQHVAAYVV